MVWKIRQSVVAALLTMLTATPALAADTNSTQWVPLSKVFIDIFKPTVPAAWEPQLKLIGGLIVLAIGLGIGLYAARILWQYEDKSQAIAEIIQLVVAVVLMAIALFKLLPYMVILQPLKLIGTVITIAIVLAICVYAAHSILMQHKG